MKRIKTILTIVAIAAISALIWAKPLDAGEVEIIALNWQEQPQEAPNTFMVNYIQPSEKEWQFEPLSELPLDPEMQIYMYELCEENNLSFAFAAMVMESETNFNPAAV